MHVSSILLYGCLAVAPFAKATAEVGLDLAQALLLQPIGLVNPTLQPSDLYQRYDTVLCLVITAVEPASRTVVLRVKTVAKGAFVATSIRLTVSEDSLTGVFQELPEVGLEVVAFVGQQGHHREGNILLYLGGEGRWQAGTVANAGDTSQPAAWAWSKNLGLELYGTFNGHPARLADLVRDCAANREFFPSTPFDRFQEDRVLALVPGATGVALYDIDGDGRLDALAAGPTGCMLLLQCEPLRFTDVSAASGLGACSGHSLDCADVDGDGRVDLLLDGQILHHDVNGHFSATGLLPAQTGQVVMSRFVDVNHDGWPDVVETIDGVGLRVFLHPGIASHGPFAEPSATLGLSSRETVAGCIIPGLFDGHSAFFIASGAGSLLIANDVGIYAPAMHLPGWNFAAVDGRTGGGACAPLWRADRLDLAFATDNGVNIATVDVATANQVRVTDVGRYGNETQVATSSCAGLLAEDLNADGNVDLYAISRAAGTTNNLYDNRGYGSFMVAERYRADVIPGSAHRQGALGAAAGDANGDGANDLLLMTTEGKLTLLLNDVLSGRTTAEHPTRMEAALAATALLHIEVHGPRGVVGAKVSVADMTGRIVGVRLIGGNAVTGCRGPDAVTLALREAGDQLVTVCWSDGAIRTFPVTVHAHTRSTLVADRPE